MSCWKKPGTTPDASSPCWNSTRARAFLSEKMHLVEAWDLTPSKGQPDDDERIETGIL